MNRETIVIAGRENAKEDVEVAWGELTDAIAQCRGRGLESLLAIPTFVHVAILNYGKACRQEGRLSGWEDAHEAAGEYLESVKQRVRDALV